MHEVAHTSPRVRGTRIDGYKLFPPAYPVRSKSKVKRTRSPNDSIKNPKARIRVSHRTLLGQHDVDTAPVMGSSQVASRYAEKLRSINGRSVQLKALPTNSKSLASASMQLEIRVKPVWSCNQRK